MKKKKYELIYVPAETYMLSPAKATPAQSFIKLSKPVNVLLLGEVGDKLSVLHENKKWLIEKKQMRGIYDQLN